MADDREAWDRFFLITGGFLALGFDGGLFAQSVSDKFLGTLIFLPMIIYVCYSGIRLLLSAVRRAHSDATNVTPQTSQSKNSTLECQPYSNQNIPMSSAPSAETKSIAISGASDFRGKRSFVMLGRAFLSLFKEDR